MWFIFFLLSRLCEKWQSLLIFLFAPEILKNCRIFSKFFRKLRVRLCMEIFDGTFKRLRYCPYLALRDRPNRVKLWLFLCFSCFCWFL